MFNKTLSVEDLNGYIRSIFQAEEMLHDVSVFGEVSGFKISGPHAYFTIKGKEAAISCNLFQYKRTYVPKDGDSVIVKGTPDFYAKTGKLSFNVVSVQPVGIGDLHAQLEQLKAKLLKEGIFAPEHKKAIPAFPFEVCVITSKTGAVIRDIYRTIRNVNNTINIHVYNVRVQGEGAENEIAHAIQRTDGKYDVIIVARGGGSFEDLAPFNTEIVARAIYNATTPIISAVGHETDFSVSDLAADSRAATPTAAAHMIAFDEAALKETVFSYLSKMGVSVQDKLKASQSDLVAVTKSLSSSARHITDRAFMSEQAAINRMMGAAKVFITAKDGELEKALIAYGAANPLASIEKGFFGATKKGKRITSVQEVAVGDDLLLIAKDGKILTEVKEIQK
ncbi:MAG TPA: exodeoxyribonuclease VII large subunit [Clostridiales bacterium]|nr:exodeoxyribonuclease VII large subunit [Clostridiales bacterium]